MSDKDSKRSSRSGRKEKLVRAGERLPTEEELLRGSPFFRDSIAEDIREYADRLARRFRKRRRTDLSPVISCLEEITIEQSAERIVALETALGNFQKDSTFDIDTIRLRCLMYRAGYGDPAAVASVSAEIAMLSLKDLRDADDCSLVWTSLGWLMLSRHLTAYDRIGLAKDSFISFGKQHDLLGYKRQFEMAVRQAISAEGKINELLPDDPQEEGRSVTQNDAKLAPASGTVIVLREVGNASVSQGRQVAKEFEKVIGRRLRLPPLPDLVGVRAKLVAEFPHAASVVDQVLKGLAGRSHVQFQPTVLLGPPGCGKTRFARRLAEELGAPYEVIPCGGMSDSSLGGTPRRWSSGEPSLPISLVRQHECAGIVIVLDEVEKVGSGKHNGNVHDVLVGLFERETSARWHDPYIQSGCDLSHLSWLMTANEVEAIPAVLRDRCRVIRFPEAGLEHLPELAIAMMERLYVDLGHDVRWATPLEGLELTAVISAWRGGSLRKLQRLLEGIIDVRERSRVQH